MEKCDKCEALRRELCAVAGVLADDLLQWLVTHGHLSKEVDCERLAKKWLRQNSHEFICVAPQLTKTA